MQADQPKQIRSKTKFDRAREEAFSNEGAPPPPDVPATVAPELRKPRARPARAVGNARSVRKGR